MGRREFGTIRRLPSDRWQASYWYDGNRHFAPHTFRTKRNAGEFLSAIETELQRGEWIDPMSGRVLISEVAKEWKATIVDLRPSTKARDMGYLERYVIPRFGSCEIREITHVMVRSWVAELDSSGLAPATTTKAFHILSKVLRFAVRARLIPSSPCDGVRLPRIERTEMRFLTAGEVDALADAIHPLSGHRAARRLRRTPCWRTVRTAGQTSRLAPPDRHHRRNCRRRRWPSTSGRPRPSG